MRSRRRFAALHAGEYHSFMITHEPTGSTVQPGQVASTNCDCTIISIIAVIDAPHAVQIAMGPGGGALSTNTIDSVRNRLGSVSSVKPKLASGVYNFGMSTCYFP